MKALSDLGGIQQAYEQAKIEAPTVRAQNVAQILRGYTYPTTTEQTYTGPAQVYQPSPLAQIAGLGSLLGAAFNTPQGGGKPFGMQAIDFLSKQFGGSSGGYDPNAPLKEYTGPAYENYGDGG